MTTNTIDTTHTHAYKLTVTYKEMGIDQSTDMNKTFSAKVNIVDLRASADNINPYSSNKNALNYQIVNSALEGGANRTTYGSEVTEFTSISGENERVLNTAPDDYGTSYYYRGNVLDNYVSFADKTWRIVRINGDGSIRLVLDDIAKDSSGNVIKTAFNSNDDDNAYIGYMYGTPGSTAYDATHENINDSTIKTVIDKWYEDNLKTNFEEYLADTLFCNDKTLASISIGNKNTALGYGKNITYYSSNKWFENINNSKCTFECAKGTNDTYSRFTSNNTETSKGIKVNNALTYPIGLLTVDEIEYAGAYEFDQSNVHYYLFNFSITSSSWLLSPAWFDGNESSPMALGSKGQLDGGFSTTKYFVRPSINLKSDVLIDGGDGTSSNPYTVKLS